jgi:hypothetical protein
MATKTITTYEHTCDLCGDPRDKAELAQLYAKRAQPIGAHYLYDQVDICEECRARPVSDVLDRLAAK